MKRVSVCIIVCVCIGFLVVACQPSRRATEATTPTVERDTIVLVRTDTVVRSFPLFIFDTTASLAILRDSFTWDHPDAKTVLVVEKDTVWRYRIRTQLKNDTLTLIRTDTVFQTVTHTVSTPDTENEMPWWLLLLVGGIAAVFGYTLKRKE